MKYEITISTKTFKQFTNFLFLRRIKHLDIFLLTIFLMVFGFTAGPLVWLYVPEIIPAETVPFATFLNWSASTLTIVITPIITHAVGSPYPVFFIFGGISMILFVLNYIFLVETKGLTPSQINAKFVK